MCTTLSRDGTGTKQVADIVLQLLAGGGSSYTTATLQLYQIHLLA